MENEAVIRKNMKVEIAGPEAETISPPSGMNISGGGLARQGSITKYNCLCSPTTHAGSFRCRLHRTPSLQRSKSIESPAYQGSETEVTASAYGPTQNNAVNAQ